MAGKFIDATLRLIDNFTRPMADAMNQMTYHSGNFVKAGKKIERAGRSIQNVGRTMTAAVTTPLAGLGIAAVKTAADFEGAMSNVQAISGASAGELEQLTEKAKEMGAKTKFSATESADAFSYMAMAGWKTGDMLEGIEGIMYLAGASGEDLAQTSDIVTDALTAFGMKAKDTDEFVDILAKTASNANTDVAMMGETFQYVAPVAGALGYSAKDVSVAIGLMANSGIKASKSGTALRSLLTNLAKPTDSVKIAMKELGVSLTDSEGNMKEFSVLMKDMRGSFSGLTKAQKAQYAATLAGETGMSGLLAIVNSSDSDFDKLTASIENSTGAAKEMYDIANDNLNGRLTVLKSTMESIAITFGERLMPYVEKGAGKLQELAEKVDSLSDAQVDQIIHWAAMAAAVGPTIFAFGKLVSGAGTMVKTIGTVGKAVQGLRKGFVAAKAVTTGLSFAKPISSLGKLGKGFLTVLGPVGSTIVIIGALIAAGVLLYKNWDTVTKKMQQFGKYISSIFSEIGVNSETIKKKASEIKGKFGEFTEKAEEMWITVKPYMEKLGEIASVVFGTILGGVIGGAIGVLSSFFDTATEIFSGILTALGGFMDFITGVFTGNWSKAWNGIKDIFGGVFSSLVALAKAPINGVISIINGAIAGINKLGIKIPDWVPLLGGKEFKINIPKIPMLYRGTNYWQGGPAMIHDKGAEIVDLPRGTRVYPHDKSIQMARQEGKGGSRNVHIAKLADTIIIRETADVDEIMKEFVRKLEQTEGNIATA